MRNITLRRAISFLSDSFSCLDSLSSFDKLSFLSSLAAAGPLFRVLLKLRAVESKSFRLVLSESTVVLMTADAACLLDVATAGAAAVVVVADDVVVDR